MDRGIQGGVVDVVVGGGEGRIKAGSKAKLKRPCPPAALTLLLMLKKGTFVPSGVFCNVPSVLATCIVPACSVTNRRPSGVRATAVEADKPSTKRV